MDPDGKWTSTRAVLLAAAGQNCWPPAGSYMAATGQDLMAADKQLPHQSPAVRRQTQLGAPRHPHSDLNHEAPLWRLLTCLATAEVLAVIADLVE